MRATRTWIGAAQPEMAMTPPTILGARTTEQLRTNLAAADLHLSAAETAALDAASDPHPPDYPYGELGVDQRDRTLGWSG